MLFNDTSKSVDLNVINIIDNHLVETTWMQLVPTPGINDLRRRFSHVSLHTNVPVKWVLIVSFHGLRFVAWITIDWILIETWMKVQYVCFMPSIY